MVLLPGQAAPSRGAGEPRASPSLSGAGGGRSLARRSPTPRAGGDPLRGGAPGERCGASPSQSRPPLRPPLPRAPQQRRLPCAVGVSASLGEWGQLQPGPGDEGRGFPEPGAHVQGFPTPPLPGFPGILVPGCRGAQGTGERVVLSRVLNAEWPAPRSPVRPPGSAPSRRGHAPGAVLVLSGWRRGLGARAEEGLELVPGLASQVELRGVFPYGGLEVFADS